MPDQILKPVVLLVAQALPVWVVFRTISYKTRNKLHRLYSFKHEILLGLFFIYVICVAAITLFPSAIYKTPRPYPVNPVPFSYAINDFKDIVKTHTLKKMLPHLVKNYLGNIVLFIPLGIFLPLIFKQCRSLRTIITAVFFCSLSIEMLQWLSAFVGIYRSSDIDDVILNTIGGIAGFLLFKHSAYLHSLKQDPVRDTATREQNEIAGCQ